MHQLLLLRHAKSSWSVPSGDAAAASDRERPLNARGRRSAALLREAMRGLGLAPDLILVSPAARTMETMFALEPWDDTPLIDPLDELYLASEKQLLETLRAVAETVRTVLMIGHNPGMHDLAMTLTDRVGSADKLVHNVMAGYPTATLVEFSLAGPWARLNAGGGRLLRMLTPRMLDGVE